MFNEYPGANDVKEPQIDKKEVPEPGTSILQIPTGIEEIDFMDRVRAHLAKEFLKPKRDGEICMYIGRDDDNVVVVHLTCKRFKEEEEEEMIKFSKAAYFGFCLGRGKCRLQK